MISGLRTHNCTEDGQLFRASGVVLRWMLFTLLFNQFFVSFKVVFLEQSPFTTKCTVFPVEVTIDSPFFVLKVTSF